MFGTQYATGRAEKSLKLLSKNLLLESLYKIADGS